MLINEKPIKLACNMPATTTIILQTQAERDFLINVLNHFCQNGQNTLSAKDSAYALYKALALIDIR